MEPPSRSASPGRTGRPMDRELTSRLLAITLTTLAERGRAGLTLDGLVTAAGAGKAAIYRRWETIDALAAEAVGALRLVATPADTGSLRGDLLALVQPWTTGPGTEGDRAAVSLLGPSLHDDDAHRALQQALVGPLAATVAELLARSAARGTEDVAPGQVELVTTAARSLWWDCHLRRHPADGPAADQLVDVLLPLAHAA